MAPRSSPLVVAAVIAAGLTSEAAGSAGRIRLGTRVLLPVMGSDAELPVLAMNASGRYVLGYAETDQFGPFGVLTGDAANGPIQPARVRQLGTKRDLSPLEPAVARDGEAALGWSVRRQLRPANRVAFGIDNSTLAAGARAGWATQTVLPATVRYDPTDNGPGLASFAFAGRRLVEDWTTETASASRLVFARQDARGRWHTRALLHTGSSATIEADGLAVDGSGHIVVVATLQPVLSATAASARTTRRETTVGFSSGPTGRLGAPQLLRRGCSAAGMAVAAGGRAAVAMICNVSGHHSQVWVSERASGRRFASPTPVSGPGVDAAFPSVSFVPGGHICVAWDRIVGTAKTFDANIVRTEVSCARLGRGFRRPVWQTDPYPTQINGPKILAGPSGLALTRGDREGRVVLQRLLPAGRLGRAVALSGPGARNQTVDVDIHGRGIAVWDADVAHRNQPEARSFTLP